MTPFVLRHATPDDTSALAAIIAASARQLSRNDYTDVQIEAAVGTAWALDTELVRDRTYFVAVSDGQAIGCGGWSRRRTLFGGDAQGGRSSDLLDPGTEPAKIRAFFVHPQWVRQGVGRAILQHCEREAHVAGFKRVELLATLPGTRLYRAFGYEGDTRVPYTLPGGIVIDFVPMTKTLP